MTAAIKRRRGTTAQHAAFTGLEGELTVDTTKKTVVVHDGATVGGVPLATQTLADSKVSLTGDETVAGIKTFSSNPTLSAGTANGVPYLNGSKVVTTGSGLTFDGTQTFKVRQNTAGTSNYSELVLDIANSFSAGGQSYLRNISLNGGNSATALAFGVNDNGGGAAAEAMRLTSTGLLINATTPASANTKLTVGTGNNTVDAVSVINTANANRSALTLSNWTGAGTTQGPRLSFDNSTQGNWTLGSGDGVNTFDICQTWGTPLVRIDSSGNLLVGTTSVDGNVGGSTGNGTYTFRVDDGPRFSQPGAGYWNRYIDGIVVEWRRGGVSVGNVSVTATTTTYNTSSDARLKQNVIDAPDAASLIDAIQVRSFDWIADGSHQRYGMVAQELAVVAPEAVSAPSDPDAMMGVDYSKLVPMLIKEVQSLRARVAQLESQ